MTTIFALFGALVGLGTTLIFLGLLPRKNSPPTKKLWIKLGKNWSRVAVRTKILGGCSIFLGALLAAWSGFLPAIVLMPVLVLGLPYLLSEPPARELDLLGALDRWIRLLITSVGTGKSIRDAIFATRTQVPEILRIPVNQLCLMLEQRTSTQEAVLLLADELDCAAADAICAALSIAAARGGLGTRTILTSLSANIQQRLSLLREITTERAKPRVVVRQVTLITVGVLSCAIALNGPFFTPYTSPLGQAIACALATVFIGCLVMIRSLTIPPATRRFLKER